MSDRFPYLLRIIICLIIGGGAVAAVFSVSPALGFEHYQLQREDVVRIIVSEHEDLLRIVTVQNNGLLHYSPVGTLQAAGLTLGDLAREIESRLADELEGVSPEVQVEVESYGNPRVHILGEVHDPGEYSLGQGQIRLLTAISLAGGPTKRADMTEVTLTRGDEIRYIDCERIREGHDLDNNLTLLPEDVIYVPRSMRLVEIKGEVKQPGAYHVEDTISFAELLSRADGPTSKADISEIRLIREGEEETIVIGLDEKLTVQDNEKPFALLNIDIMPGDLIRIPSIGEESNWTDYLQRIEFLQVFLEELW